jgi:LemA protein
MIPLYILLGAVAIFFLWLAATYNSLVGLRNQVKNAWAQIDVQLKRRHDLIPNLIETVRGYMTHERETLDSVTRARNAASQASGVAAQSQAETVLSQALGRLLVTVEAYPDLKANQNFLALQEELTSTENKIGFARQFYNDQAMQFNNRIQMFPSNFVANAFAFKLAEFFEVEDTAERAVPTVSFK